MDQYPLDVCRSRWTGVECGIIAFAELWPAVSVMEIDDNVGGIEQDNQVLREISDGVNAQLLVAEQDRSGLRNRESGTHNREIDIR